MELLFYLYIINVVRTCLDGNIWNRLHWHLVLNFQFSFKVTF